MMLASWTRPCPLLFVVAAMLLLLGINTASGRDGVTGCFIAEVDTETGKVWRHKIDVQIPDGAHCRLYVKEDEDRKSWRYCSLKRAAQNPVSETCDDPVDDRDFDAWMAKAVCAGTSYIASCRREKPLQPGQLSED